MFSPKWAAVDGLLRASLSCLSLRRLSRSIGVSAFVTPERTASEWADVRTSRPSHSEQTGRIIAPRRVLQMLEIYCRSLVRQITDCGGFIARATELARKHPKKRLGAVVVHLRVSAFEAIDTPNGVSINQTARRCNAGQVKVSIAELLLDHRQPLEEVADAIFHRHPNAAV